MKELKHFLSYEIILLRYNKYQNHELKIKQQ